MRQHRAFLVLLVTAAVAACSGVESLSPAPTSDKQGGGSSHGDDTAVVTGPSEKKEGNGNRERDTVSDLVIANDGKWLAASVGEDEDVVLCWGVKAGNVKHRLKPAGKPVGFTPDGSENRADACSSFSSARTAETKGSSGKVIHG